MDGYKEGTTFLLPLHQPIVLIPPFFRYFAAFTSSKEMSVVLCTCYIFQQPFGRACPTGTAILTIWIITTLFMNILYLLISTLFYPGLE